HGPGPGGDRGADQGVLARGVQHRGLHHYGHRAAAASGRSVWEGKMNRQVIGSLVAVLVLALLPALGAYPIFVMKVMCYALFACAFNLLLGYTGLLSFGHAAFLGGAAYAAGHAMAVWGWSTALGLLFGTAVAALMGLVMG